MECDKKSPRLLSALPGGTLIPIFYGGPAYDRRHLQAVMHILGDLPGGCKLQFFVTRKGALAGLTPLQALAAGRLANVKDIAAAFSQTPVTP